MVLAFLGESLHLYRLSDAYQIPQHANWVACTVSGLAYAGPGSAPSSERALTPYETGNSDRTHGALLALVVREAWRDVRVPPRFSQQPRRSITWPISPRPYLLC